MRYKYDADLTGKNDHYTYVFFARKYKQQKPYRLVNLHRGPLWISIMCIGNEEVGQRTVTASLLFANAFAGLFLKIRSSYFV